ncbi:hypothetical protein QJS10_CPB14g01109 [Acorus calamus]|uniref:ENT domain-containing protein n=1 Tax=Acorus calamus TaxID=4465 RepID=A0AAV9DD17_ACOCL|nr:hypothetical protein QJS10_CPB14g01109 [Acorus calamus]
MRFKKGSKVEVLNKSTVPSGSWRCAKIVSGNGHTYNVKYDMSPSNMSEVITERVPRKAIRPIPPPVEGVVCWAPGDIVEVFEMSSWKLAEVSGVVSRNYCFVRLLGSVQEFKVHKSFIRVRQSWQDGRWVVIGKDSGNLTYGKLNKMQEECVSLKTSFLVPLSLEIVKRCPGDDYYPVEKSMPSSEEYLCRKKRRSPVEISKVNGKKQKVAEKDDRYAPHISEHAHHFLEKVDAVSYPQKMLGENYVQTQLYNNTAGFPEMDVEKGNPNSESRFFHNSFLESRDAETESDACSVGSCSPSHNPCNFSHYPFVDYGIDRDSEFDDAESFCGREPRSKKSEFTKGDLGAEIHQLELHAYRRTMEALYASGPLSWDQETVMTNLRLMLHISNDEHLSELRHLVSNEINS